MTLVSKLQKLEACDSAACWVAKNSDLSPEELWIQCPKPDWMVWLVFRATQQPRGEPRRRAVALLVELITKIASQPDQPLVESLKAFEEWATTGLHNQILKTRFINACANVKPGLTLTTVSWMAESCFTGPLCAADNAAGVISLWTSALDHDVCKEIILKRYPVPPEF